MMQQNNKHFISKEWYEKLLSDLNNFKNIEMPAILGRLSEAKALWDLSENFEYKSALEERDLANSKIAELEQLIENSEIIKDDNSKKEGKISYWSIVELELESGKIYTVEIVGTGEVEITDDSMKISLQSPIGYAIKDKKEWDSVQMRLDNDRQKVKILSVKYK